MNRLRLINMNPRANEGVSGEKININPPKIKNVAKNIIDF